MDPDTRGWNMQTQEQIRREFEAESAGLTNRSRTWTSEEIALWNEWLHTDDGRHYESGWGDDSNRHRAERGKSWVAGRIAERRLCEAEITRLRGIIDVITAPPMTPAEAEAALDSLPELDPDEEAVRRMIEAARKAEGFDGETLREVEAWLERRFQ